MNKKTPDFFRCLFGLKPPYLSLSGHLVLTIMMRFFQSNSLQRTNKVKVLTRRASVKIIVVRLLIEFIIIIEFFFFKSAAEH